MYLFAHVGPCRAPEVASTIAISGAVGVALFRPWRRRTVRDRAVAWAVPLVLAAVVTGGACAPKSGSKSARPTTPVQIAIVAPAQHAVVGPDTTLQVQLSGGRVVARTSGKLTPTEGHIHVFLDDALVSMAYQTTQDLHGLKPGPHTLKAEFVAVDHAPFKNRPTAVALFTVK